MTAGGHASSVLAGPDGDKIAALVGRAFPMRYQPGLVARLDCGDAPIRRLLHAPRVEMRPDGPGRLVAHSKEVDARLSGHGQVRARIPRRA